MTLSRSFVDGFLVEWEEGEYAAQVKTMRQTSRAIIPEIPTVAGGGKSATATASRAQAIRARLARTIKRVPEVMVKITSSCRGMRQIGRHLDYISRKGQIEVEDQDGFVWTGKEPLKELKSDWRTGGPEEIGAESTVRDTLNIVFSMPAHTDEVAMKRAVRAFAAERFQGHQYVFAYHTAATDPDPNPPAHPHVHLSVKTQGRSGRRLNPRKADLQAWREGFAGHLRAHGIETNATSRLARLKRERGTKRSVIALGQRGEGPLARDGEAIAPDPARLNRARKLEADRRAYYALAAATLQQSEDRGDQALGKGLAESLLPQAPDHHSDHGAEWQVAPDKPGPEATRE